jgi:hypothetical protein
MTSKCCFALFYPPLPALELAATVPMFTVTWEACCAAAHAPAMLGLKWESLYDLPGRHTVRYLP